MKNLKSTIALLSILTMSLSCKDTAKEELVAVNNDKPTMEKPVEEEAITGYDIGSVATDFKLKNIDGKMVSLANYKDAKGFIIIFTCNHCPYSVAYEDRIIAIDKKFKEKGYPVIAINPNNPTAVCFFETTFKYIWNL